MSARAATWIAVPICLLNIAMGVLGFVFGVLNGYTLIELANEVAPGAILAMSFSIVGALVASRRPENPIGWIFCIIGLSQGLVTFANEYATYVLITKPGTLWGGPVMAWLAAWSWMPGLGLLLTFALLLFPNGRLPSPHWRVVAWLSAIDLALIVPIAIAAWPARGRALLEDADQVLLGGLFDIMLGTLYPLMLVCGLASVISLSVRFRSSQGIERQQLKWFTYAGIISFAAVIINEVLGGAWALLLPVVPSLPVAAGIAILRYRLYDIDLVIRRTLIYSALTGLLALAYFGSVVLLQQVFHSVTGEMPDLVIVASTLAIAALFLPLRRHVQNVIDKRFYRRKYDAAKTLAAFSVTVRDEVDLSRLTDGLIGVVEETMRPAHISLWLKGASATALRRRDAQESTVSKRV